MGLCLIGPILSHQTSSTGMYHPNQTPQGIKSALIRIPSFFLPLGSKPFNILQTQLSRSVSSPTLLHSTRAQTTSSACLPPPLLSRQTITTTALDCGPSLTCLLALRVRVLPPTGGRSYSTHKACTRRSSTFLPLSNPTASFLPRPLALSEQQLSNGTGTTTP